MNIHTCAQRSEEWYRLRAGIPTASEFSKLVTSTGERSKSLKGYAVTLANEAFVGMPVDAWEGNVWSERGRDLEDEALRLYEFAHDVAVEDCGFVTTDDGMAGCSPDGLVGNDGMVEIKCLKGERHTEVIMYYQKHGRCQPAYVQQTQGQMLVAERKWCDLIFMHPQLPMLTIRQEPDPKLWDALNKGITDVIAERDRVLAALKAAQAPTAQAAE